MLVFEPPKKVLRFWGVFRECCSELHPDGFHPPVSGAPERIHKPRESKRQGKGKPRQTNAKPSLCMEVSR